jgi:hypothetical protein
VNRNRKFMQTCLVNDRWRTLMFRRFVAACVLIACSVSLSFQTLAADLEELKLKACAIRTLAVRTEWRDDDFRTKDAPIVIGMIRSNPFKDERPDFTALLTEGKIAGHEVKVVVLQKLEDIEQCHILFISLKERSNMKDVIAKLKSIKDKRVLTISDIPEFKEGGGIAKISAVQTGPKKFTPHIDVNWEELKNVGWKFDNQLTVAIRKMQN